MKRRLGRGLLVILLAAITLLFPLLAAPHRIDQAHRELIRSGMTLAEVEAIFGVPAGEYDWATRDNRFERFELAILEMELIRLEMDSEQMRMDAIKRNLAQSETALAGLRISPLGRDPQTWTSRHGSVTIWFNDAGRVTSVGNWHSAHVEPPWQRWWRKVVKK
jgi:hypothetical protein